VPPEFEELESLREERTPEAAGERPVVAPLPLSASLVSTPGLPMSEAFFLPVISV
jgi:hypothetical protein